MAALSAYRRGRVRLPQAPPGMFIELARRHGVALGASTHVGDSEKDRAAAAAAGVGTFVWARDFFGWADEPGRD
jgi:FMN phosphatase YigB (HAD superfamily)